MRKAIYISLILFTFIVIGSVVYLWNKPHRNIDNVQTETVSAEIISQLFEKDEALANKNYLNKALTVSGIVGDVSDNEIGEQVILLKGHDDFSGVQCTLKEKNDEVNIGDSIKISGFCNGYTVVVILDECKLLN